MKGKQIILIAAVVSGISVFVNSLAVKTVPNPYFFTTAKNIITVLFIFSFIAAIGKWKVIRNLSKNDWLKLYLLGLIGGSIPFLLFFKGLSIAVVAANGAFIQKTMFIWVMLFATLYFKEKISFYQQIGLASILFGIILMGGIKYQAFGLGEVYVLMATLLWSFEALLVSKYAKQLTPDILAFGRMFFGSLFMLSYILLTQKPAIFFISYTQIHWVIITSIFLLFYVLTYYQALAKNKTTEVTAVLTVGFPVTILCQNLYSAKPISILPIIFIVIGAFIYLISKNHKVLLWKA